MLKKVLAILLSVSLLAAIFSGCNNGSSVSSSSTAEQSQTESSSTVENTVDPDWPAIGTAEEPVQVSFILKDIFPDEPDMITLLETIEEKMAAHGQYLDIVLLEPRLQIMQLHYR